MLQHNFNNIDRLAHQDDKDASLSDVPVVVFAYFGNSFGTVFMLDTFSN